MVNGLLLWVDDEIELLKAHILFLEKKEYEVITVSNGTDAIEQCRKHSFDLILLDEMMPGLSGLETLQKIKEIAPAVPVVMVTKSEEENIMDQAIGSKISDYLIKPVNPNQILLTLKKNIHQKEIVTEVTQSSYQQSFSDLSDKISKCKNYNDWINVYKQLVHWELELSSTDSSMTEMLKMQKEDANIGFAKFIKENYLSWVKPVQPETEKDNLRNTITARNTSNRQPQQSERPMMSPDVFKKKIFPLLSEGSKVFLIVLDNFRYDQWRMLAQEIGDMFDISEELYYSILPTATDQTGNVVAVSNGSATITVIVNGMSATCQITVTGKEVLATAVTVSPTTISLTSVAQISQLSTSIIPSDATNVTYSWTSSNTSVATVSQSGLVSAVASGTAVITVTTAGGLKATSTVTVSILATTTTTKYSVNSSSCTGCGKCKSACSSGAISISGGKAIIDASKCTACGKCYSRCPHGAIVKTVTTNSN